VLGLDAIEHRCRLRARLQLGLGRLGEFDEELRVLAPGRRPVALPEPVESVAPHRLEHRETPGA
jgi:hypothetical protein